MENEERRTKNEERNEERINEERIDVEQIVPPSGRCIVRFFVLRTSFLVLLGFSAACAALLPASTQQLNALKNRTALPGYDDFDRTVTLEAILAPGDDTNRWSTRKAATIQGYVVRVLQARMESANRFSPTRRDTHIEVALRPDAPPRERVILEVTPQIRDWARLRSLDWSTEALRTAIVGRLCQFEGWLLFDIQHVAEAENTNPGDPDNWRATAWELHPVTAITLMD